MAGQNQGGNTDLFDVYFRRADLDGDGRISGAEAVGFFQGSNLPKHVLAQVWTHADQARTGFLGRTEFYNALKLVTVAQSKRELTPDIVKAALYGPAAAKIPAPQINLAATPAPQSRSMAAPPAPQMGAVGPTSSQNFGFRGPGAPNASMGQPHFPSQQNQSMRPPQAMPVGTSPRPPQAVPNSNVSGDWFSGRTSGAPTGAMPQGPNRGNSPSLPSTASIPQNIVVTSSQPTTKDSKSPVASGNGYASNTNFGGDVFSAISPLPKQDSNASNYSASSPPAPSTIAPVSPGPRPSVKTGPISSLQGSFSMGPTGGQLQRGQTAVNPNQQVSAQSTSSFASSGISGGAGNSTSNQSQLSWPKMKPTDVQKYTKVFVEVDTDRDGKITGEQARNLFLSWRLPREVLKQVWDLSDQDNDSMLSLREFCIALYLMERYREGQHLPSVLPSNLLYDETLLAVAGQTTASYGNAAWGPNPGVRQHQGMSGARPMAPASGSRPPLPYSTPQTDRSMQPNLQKSRGPTLEDPFANQLGNEQNQNTRFQEGTDEEKKVKEVQKVILDSREKMEFYRTMMQELVLYKSRCENRLNEITERAIADKREAESLGKKYEEKYKQVADIASKLTVEEARFRDIQERKTELQQAIVKMEQGGSADGILQVRADRIQTDLDELMKALTDRCKKHGLQINSAALFELPIGWQPGFQEGSADWDEDWDKFEDEGFSFDKELNVDVRNGIASPNPHSTSAWIEKGSPNDSVTSDSFSNADGKSEKPLHAGEYALESESAYAHSEDDFGRSSPASPALESPSQEFPDNHFRKSTEVDAETHSSFDESAWGTFDNNDDTDSVWGFNPDTTKDSVTEQHRENYFFDSGDLGINPIRTESPESSSTFQNKSLFADSVPGTPLSRFGNSPPRYSESAGNNFFDSSSRFDSFSINDSGFSPRGELTRFDSINSTSDFVHSRGLTSFDDADPFGSTGPFKVSSESQTARKETGSWSAF